MSFPLTQAELDAIFDTINQYQIDKLRKENEELKRLLADVNKNLKFK